MSYIAFEQQVSGGWFRFCCRFAGLCDDRAFELPRRKLGRLRPVVEPIAQAVCAYVDPPPATPQLAFNRWTPVVEQTFTPLVATIKAALEKERGQVTSEEWHAMQTWLDAVAFESEALEIRALTAPIGEAMFYELAGAHGESASERDR